MPTIEALREAANTLQRNPVLFAAGLVNAVIALPQTGLSVVQMTGSSQTAATAFLLLLVSLFLSLVAFLIAPFLIAGTIGMAREGLAGSTTFGTFTKIGKEKYLSTLGALLARVALFAVLYLVFAVGFGLTAIFVIGFSAGAGGPFAGIGAAGVAAIALLALLWILPFLIAWFLLQFLAPAIVVDDCGAVESFKRSYSVVRSNGIETLGYVAIVTGVGILVAVPSVLSSFAAQGQSTQSLAVQPLPEFGGTLAIVGPVVSWLAGIVVFPFHQTFATAFYVRHTSGAAVEDGPDESV